MKPIPFAEINRELVPKDPLEAMKYGTALAEKCRLGHNAEPQTPDGNRRRKSLWLPRIRAACAIRAQAMLSLPKPKSEDDIIFDRHKFLKTNDGKAIFHSIDENKIFISSDLSIPKEIDPLEDFTTYTEYDPENRIAIASSTITVVNMARNDTGYVYRDYGSNYFQEFVHYVQLHINGVGGSGTNDPISAMWAVSNSVRTMYGWISISDYALACAIRYYVSGGNYELFIRNFNTLGIDSTAIQASTVYYLTIERASNTATVYIYTNSDKTILLDTLTVAATSSVLYRYIFGAVANGYIVSSPGLSFLVANLDLNTMSFQPAWAEGINTHHF